MEIKLLSDVMGAEATGVDLSKALSDAEKSELNDALHKNIVLCIRDQKLDGPSFVAACRVFGDLMRQVNESLCDPALPELGMVTSEDYDTQDTKKRVIRGTSWHTDHSFTEKPPKASSLYAVAIPSSGGDTSFCNLRAAYQALPEATRNDLEGLKARHQFRSSRAPKQTFIKLNGETERIERYKFAHPLARQHLPTG
ncbi:MAG: TauD/TfdA family dioxygenase, partial [Proteobacteria bacterium]|nr:TauD/TfdA family dioxygenase [Pseudomonadota bacterium]